MRKEELLEGIRVLLWEYYFDNPPTYKIDTDDIDIKESKIDNYMEYMTDIEMLENIINLIKDNK